MAKSKRQVVKAKAKALIKQTPKKVAKKVRVQKKAASVPKAARMSASEKATGRPTTQKMVAEAFASLKNRKGNSLAAVRNYITNNYDVNNNKTLQTNIKKYINEEYEAGRIKMVNYAKKDINFSQRFALVK